MSRGPWHEMAWTANGEAEEVESPSSTHRSRFACRTQSRGSRRTRMTESSDVAAVHAATTPAATAVSTGSIAGSSPARRMGSPKVSWPSRALETCRARALRLPLTTSSQATVMRPRSSIAICGCDGFGGAPRRHENARREPAPVAASRVKQRAFRSRAGPRPDPLPSLSPAGFTPSEVTTTVGSRVTFVNADSRPHALVGAACGY
jgi:hypothetical protein